MSHLSRSWGLLRALSLLPLLAPFSAPSSSLSWGSFRPPGPTRALSFLASPGASIAPVQIAEPLGVSKSRARGEGKESRPLAGRGQLPFASAPPAPDAAPHTAGAESVQ